MNTEITTKRCPSCGQVKPISEFNKCAKSGDGLQHYCRECQQKKAKESYQSKAGKNGDNPLANFKPRELIEELKARGYKGELHYTYTILL